MQVATEDPKNSVCWNNKKKELMMMMMEMMIMMLMSYSMV